MTQSLDRQPAVYWFTEGFFPPLVGGQELIASHLARGLSERGMDVHVITRQTVPRSAARESFHGVEIRRIDPAGVLKGRGWRAIPPLLGFLLRLIGILLRDARRYDVVIVSGVKIMPLVTIPLAWLLGKKCMLRAESYFELHEMISTESLRAMGKQRGRALFRALEAVRSFMLRRAAAVVSISEQIRVELVRRGVAEERIHSIPNGVSLARFAPLADGDKDVLRRRLGLPADRLIVLYSGRLSRAKGIPLLMSAWPTLLGRHPQLALVVVGSGNRSFDDCEREVKAEATARGLTDSVTFFEETAAIVDFLHAADLWVFPTEYEGFSLALVEAMGCALPVVATAVGAAPQIIRDGVNGFIYPPKSESQLIEAVDRALGQRDRWIEIGRAARETVAEYDIERVADRYASLCRELAAR